MWAALAALTGACGEDAAQPDDAARAASTTTAAPGHEPPTFEDRSLLSLLPSVETLDEGAFHISAPEDLEGTHLAATASGWFWSTEDSVYTRVEIDREVVDGHIDAVLARPGRQTIDPAASDLIYLRDDYYRGDELQFGIGRLVTWLGFASPVESIAFPLVEECRAALDALEGAVSELAAALEPAFEPAGHVEAWEFPLDELERRTATERARITEVCTSETSDDDHDARPGLRFERSGDRLDVLIDPGIYTSPVDVLALTVVVEPAAAVPDPPVEPDPADAFDPVNVFIAKINECGGLPWEYSNFAAANSYSAPDADDYLGPTFFVSDYVCESEVPQDVG